MINLDKGIQMKVEKILKQMSLNKRDWDIKSFLAVSKALNISYRNNGTTHFVFSHTNSFKNVSIPNHKDIHPDYVTQFLRFVALVEKPALAI
jgi:hypothetical protein